VKSAMIYQGFRGAGEGPDPGPSKSPHKSPYIYEQVFALPVSVLVLLEIIDIILHYILSVLSEVTNRRCLWKSKTQRHQIEIGFWPGTHRMLSVQ